ncbi:MAG: hypothetical protein Q4D02_00945 [Clostridia bacterium]|nr:hypothetical protein [Clostridia bacterium]
MEKMKNNENKSICSICGGRCCKSMGCHLSPEDVFRGEEPNVMSILKLLKTGYFSVDWWEGDPRAEISEDMALYITMFIRVMNVNGKVIDPSWGGKCKLLTSHGCALSFEQRPKGGKALIPQADFNCQSSYDKKEAAIEWVPYQDLISRALDLL